MSVAIRPSLKVAKRPFWWAEHRLIDCSVISHIGSSTWCVYTCMLRHSNHEGVAFPSIALLQSETGLSNRVIAQAIKRLQATFLIAVRRATHQHNTYRILDALKAIELNGWAPVRSLQRACAGQTSALATAEQVTQTLGACDFSSPELVTKSHAKKKHLRRTKEKEVGVTNVTGDARGAEERSVLHAVRCQLESTTSLQISKTTRETLTPTLQEATDTPISSPVDTVETLQGPSHDFSPMANTPLPTSFKIPEALVAAFRPASQAGLLPPVGDATDAARACQAALPAVPEAASPVELPTSFKIPEALIAAFRRSEHESTLPPVGGAADAAVTDKDLEFLFGVQVSDLQETTELTGIEDVPRATAPERALEAPATRPVGCVSTPIAVGGPRALLASMVGGQNSLRSLLQELTPSGALSRQAWLDLPEDRLLDLRESARREAQAKGTNFRTLVIRGLDRIIGAPTKAKPGGPAGTTALPSAYLTAAEKQAQLAQRPVPASDQHWQGRNSKQVFKIEEVTTESVFVEGLGEYPLQRFYQVFEPVKTVALTAAHAC